MVNKLGILKHHIEEHDLSEANPVKVLGMLWHTETDEISLSPNLAEFHQVRTKHINHNVSWIIRMLVSNNWSDSSINIEHK